MAAADGARELALEVERADRVTSKMTDKLAKLKIASLAHSLADPAADLERDEKEKQKDNVSDSEGRRTDKERDRDADDGEDDKDADELDEEHERFMNMELRPAKKSEYDKNAKAKRG